MHPELRTSIGSNRHASQSPRTRAFEYHPLLGLDQLKSRLACVPAVTDAQELARIGPSDIGNYQPSVRIDNGKASVK